MPEVIQRLNCATAASSVVTILLQSTRDFKSAPAEFAALHDRRIRILVANTGNDYSTRVIEQSRTSRNFSSMIDSRITNLLPINPLDHKERAMSWIVRPHLSNPSLFQNLHDRGQEPRALRAVHHAGDRNSCSAAARCPHRTRRSSPALLLRPTGGEDRHSR